MSAAAAARLRQSRSRRAPLPPELSEQIEIPKTDFTVMPNAMFPALWRKCRSFFEQSILLMIIHRSYGGKPKPGARPKGDGDWERPKWVELPASEIAVELGNVDEEGYGKLGGIEKCLKALEERGLIESRLIGRTNHYRICPENFESAPDRQARTIERKPPEPAEEAHVREVRASEPLILLAGEKSRPFVLGDYHGKIRSLLKFPISVLPSIDDDGELDIAIEPHLGENKAKTKHHTPVGSSVAAHENNGRSTKSDSGREADGNEKTSRNLKISAAAQIERAERGMMRDFLIRWFGPELGVPADEVIEQSLEKLRPANYEDFAGRAKKRVPELKFLTWKLVVDLAADCGREAIKRNARLGRPATPEPVLSAADMAELDQFSKRQAARFRK